MASAYATKPAIVANCTASDGVMSAVSASASAAVHVPAKA
jgi:hypothetical protein